MVLLIVILYANEGEYVMASIIILILKCFLFLKNIIIKRWFRRIDYGKHIALGL